MTRSHALGREEFRQAQNLTVCETRQSAAR